jgi:hypothetical protein
MNPKPWRTPSPPFAPSPVVEQCTHSHENACGVHRPPDRCLVPVAVVHLDQHLCTSKQWVFVYEQMNAHPMDVCIQTNECVRNGYLYTNK